MSVYCGCFDEACDVAELLYDVLAGVVLTCQYGDAEGHLALELLGRLHTVEAGVSVGCTSVAELTAVFDCLGGAVGSGRSQAESGGVSGCHLGAVCRCGAGEQCRALLTGA